jgi:magnesium-transporting ATPase (P-type)
MDPKRTNHPFAREIISVDNHPNIYIVSTSEKKQPAEKGKPAPKEHPKEEKQKKPKEWLASFFGHHISRLFASGKAPVEELPSIDKELESSFEKELPKKVWGLTWEEVTKALDLSLEEGLHSAEAKKRIKLYGPNRLREVEAQSAWSILLNQIMNLIVLFLLAASGLSFAFGEIPQSMAIAVVIVMSLSPVFIGGIFRVFPPRE